MCNTDICNTVASEGIESIVSDIEGVVEVKVIGDLASSTFDDETLQTRMKLRGMCWIVKLWKGPIIS